MDEVLGNKHDEVGVAAQNLVRGMLIVLFSVPGFSDELKSLALTREDVFLCED